MIPCDCTDTHPARRIVVTGGPGAGKTAALELLRRSPFCQHFQILPESAGIVFGGGFPRRTDDCARRAAQRAIFHVQREMEASVSGDNAAVIICDRGTVDGAAYWPGPDDFFAAIGTTLDCELARYDIVIHVRTPSPATAYNRANPLRIESALEAHTIDLRILDLWEQHPRRFVLESVPDFLTKASRLLEIVRNEVPACCLHRLNMQLHRAS